MASDIMVTGAYAPASLTPMAQSAAVYLSLVNHGSEMDVLLAIKTDAAEAAEAHQSLDENGIMKMRALERLEIKPQETVALQPGGTHIMLMGLKQPLLEGQVLSFQLTFERAGIVKVDVPVRGKTAGQANTGKTNTGHEHPEVPAE